MVITYNKETDMKAMIKIAEFIKKEIMKVDPSAADDLGEELTMEKFVEQLKSAQDMAPDMITVIETSTEVMIMYKAEYIEATVDFITEVTPLILPIAKTFFDLIELCTGVVSEIKEAANRYVSRFVSRVTRGMEE